MMVLTFVYDPPNYNLGFEINKKYMEVCSVIHRVAVLWVSKHIIRKQEGNKPKGQNVYL